ncbi:telomere length regulation protein-domain-containing protein [Terfezia claveryi]|nr:telomere length regulation protein-domain-containing protein [Terfezia claveryi]
MDNLLNPIQTRPLPGSLPITLSLSGLRPSSHEPTEEPLLTISSSKSTSVKRPVVSPIPSPVPTTTGLAPVSPAPEATSEPEEIQSAEDALKYLRSSPSLGQLEKVLEYLTTPAGGCKKVEQLGIYSPTPMSSQLVRVLVEEIIPHFWHILGKGERKGLVRCLRSVVGVSGVVARLGELVKVASGDEKLGWGVHGEMAGTRELMEVLCQVLGKINVLWEVWRGVFMGGAGGGGMKGEILWKEWVRLVAGGKLLGIASAARGEGMGCVEEYEGRIVGGKKFGTDWVGDAKVYAQWLGKGIGVMAERLGAIAKGEEGKHLVEMGWKCLRSLFWKSFGLGANHWGCWESSAAAVMRASGVINGIARLDPGFWTLLVEWIHSAAGVGEGIGIRRAVIAVLSTEGGEFGIQGGPQEVKSVLEKAMKKFGDSLWIKHTPIQVQEVNIQTIFLCAGYLHRANPAALKRIVQSSVYLNGISNRLATQSPRARFLGMVVGEVLSGLVDDKGMKLDFKMEEMEEMEATWWKGLVGVEDKVGDIYGLERVDVGSRIKGEGRKKVAKRRNISVQEVTEGMDEEEYVVEVLNGEIEEIDEVKGDSSDDDDEFQPYPKPEDDEEDDEVDDPTLVNRNKTPPPVYIRDLLRLLRSHDNYEHQLLALTHAAPLIRRKAAFGTELTEHLHDLATSLAGLQDKFDIGGFQEMKIKALIALIVGKPVEMGRWIARAFFEGDFSIGGRAVLLTALGMGARELGGLKDGEEEDGGRGMLGLGAPSGERGEASFPSKMLPGKLHELYSSPPPATVAQTRWKAIQSANSKKQITDTTRKVDAIASSLEKAMIKPMAASAADELSGPNILKVRTFSSRMAVEAKRKKPEANKLAKIVGEAFFYPLTGRWWTKLKEFGPNAPQFHPYLLGHLLKTLALVLHAAGPSCPQLPQLTREFWDLILGLRTKGASVVEDNDAPTVLEAVLFCLLTVLELNMDLGESGRRWLVEEHARELVETVEGTGVEEKVRMLAAAVVLRVRECAEGFERRLRGEMGKWE